MHGFPRMSSLHETNSPRGRDASWAKPQVGTFLLAVLAVVAAVYALRAAESVLKPLAFAWVLVGLLSPMVRGLVRLRLPRSLAILLLMILTLLVFVQAGSFLNGRILAFAAKYGDYSTKLSALAHHFYSELPEPVARMLADFDWQSRLSRTIFSLSGSLLSLSSTFIFVMIVVAFLLVGQTGFARKLYAAFTGDAFLIDAVLASIARQVGRYLLLQFLISAATGLAVWLVLWALGIDFAMTWGALAFILNFIPTIGSMLASIPPVLMALVQHAPERYWPVLVVAVVLLAIQMTIGNVVAPRILGEHMNLSPEVVLISLLFWGWLWGPGGALLSVPITASIKIICDNVAPLKPWGVMLGSGRGLPEPP